MATNWIVSRTSSRRGRTTHEKRRESQNKLRTVRRKPDADNGSIHRACKSKQERFGSFDGLPQAIDSPTSRHAVAEVNYQDHCSCLSVNNHATSQSVHVASKIHIQDERSLVKDIFAARALYAHDVALLVPDTVVRHHQKDMWPQSAPSWCSLYDDVSIASDGEAHDKNTESIVQLEDDVLFSQTEEELFLFTPPDGGVVGQHENCAQRPPLDKEDSLVATNYFADVPETLIRQKTYRTSHETLQDDGRSFVRGRIGAVQSKASVFQEDYYLSEDDVADAAAEPLKENDDASRRSRDRHLQHKDDDLVFSLSQRELFARSANDKSEKRFVQNDFFAVDLARCGAENHENSNIFQQDTALFSREESAMTSQPKDDGCIAEDGTLSALVSEGSASQKNSNDGLCSIDELFLHSHAGDDGAAMPLRKKRRTSVSQRARTTSLESGDSCNIKVPVTPPLHVEKHPAPSRIKDKRDPNVTPVEIERSGQFVVDDMHAGLFCAGVTLSRSEREYHGAEERMFTDDAFDSAKVCPSASLQKENVDAKREQMCSGKEENETDANEDTSSIIEDIFADCWSDEVSNASALALPVTQEDVPRLSKHRKPALADGRNSRTPKPKITVNVVRRGKTTRSQLATRQNSVEQLAGLSSWSAASSDPLPRRFLCGRHKSSSSCARASEECDRRKKSWKGRCNDTHGASNGPSSPWRASQTERLCNETPHDAPFSKECFAPQSVALGREFRLPSRDPSPQVQTGIQDGNDAPQPNSSPRSQEKLKLHTSEPAVEDTTCPTKHSYSPALLASQPCTRKTQTSVPSADCASAFEVPFSPDEYHVVKKPDKKPASCQVSLAGLKDANAPESATPRNGVKIPHRASVKRPLDGRASARARKRPKSDQEIALGRNGAPLVRLLCQAWWHRDRLPVSHLDWKDHFAVKYNEERKKPNNRNWPELSVTHGTVSDDTLVIQSMIYANSGGKSDAALWIVPRSHLFTPSLPPELKNSHNERVSNPSELRDRIKLELPTGSAVFWNSRLIHQGGRSEYIMKRQLKTYHHRAQQSREQEQADKKQEKETGTPFESHDPIQELKQRHWDPMPLAEPLSDLPSSPARASSEMNDYADEADLLPTDVAPCVTPHFFEYPTNDAEWAHVREYFGTEGYIVIRDFLDADEVTATLADFVNDVKHLCPHARLRVHNINDITCGMINQNIAKNALLGSINFGRAAWRMRLHPRRIRLYAELYNCMEEELVTSLDGGFFAPQASDAEPKPPQRLAFTGCLMHKMHVEQGRQQQKLAMAVLGIRTTTHWASTVELARWTYRSYYAGPLRKVGGYVQKYECMLHEVETVIPEYVDSKVTEEERKELLEAIKLEEKVVGTQGLGGLPLIMAWPTERLKELLGDKAKWL